MIDVSIDKSFFLCERVVVVFIILQSFPGSVKAHFASICVRFIGQHRIMGQGDSARDFDTSESMKNAGILDVFPIFHTARLGQKIRRSLQLPLCGVAIDIELLNEKCLPCEVRKRNDRPSAVIFAGFPRMGKMTL